MQSIEFNQSATTLMASTFTEICLVGPGHSYITLMLDYACSDVVYIAETAMCTETKVFSVEYMHGQEEMATKQQYASCKMHIAAVLSHERVNCHEPPTPKPQFASCMIHNASCKWPCSGNERSLFHMEWNFSDLQMLHVLACT